MIMVWYCKMWRWGKWINILKISGIKSLPDTLDYKIEVVRLSGLILTFKLQFGFETVFNVLNFVVVGGKGQKKVWYYLGKLEQ